MSFDTFRKKKAAEILVVLLRGARGIREIQEVVEGSNTTIIKRIEELLEVGLIEEVHLTGEEYGEIRRNKRLLRLTDEGRRLARSLVESGFLKFPLLNKAREKWIVSILSILEKIRGRTRFMKLLFLLRYELGLNKGSFFKFKAWIYGPFSKDVIEDLEELRNQALMNEKTVLFKKGELREEEVLFEYTLSTEGKKIALELLDDLSDDELQKIKRLKTFNQMSLKNLLAYTYRAYPKFITKSEIVEEILGESRSPESENHRYD